MEDDAQLKRLIDQRYSASAIGQRMGRSRNSVIGRSHRLKKPCQGKIEAGKKGRFSAAEDAMIASMAKAGKSGSHIAGILGRQKESVVVRARLIGCPLRGKSGPEKKAKALDVDVRKNAFSVVAIAARKEARQNEPEFTHITPAVAVEPLMLSLMELRPNSCRFPIGDPLKEPFGFCGHPKEQGSYCRNHALIVYTTPEQRRAAA